MAVALPWQIDHSYAIVVTKLAKNATDGGTDVECMVYGRKLSFWLKADVTEVGADTLLPDLVGTVVDMISDALETSA